MNNFNVCEQNTAIDNLLKNMPIPSFTKKEFNIFQLCGVGSTEMRHSQILADLLDPQGSHGFGAVFLKAFFEITGLTNMHPKNMRVETELAFENGRMDLVISNWKDREFVVIENKIFARDQDKQLQRYEKWLEKNAGKKEGKAALLKGKTALLYLTLSGHAASNAEGVNYKKISYEKEIAGQKGIAGQKEDGWLARCIKIADGNDLIKNVLQQYQKFINKLTGEKMEEAIAEINTSKETFSAAYSVALNFDNALQTQIKKIAEECKPERMEFHGENCDNGRFASFSYHIPGKSFDIRFEFQSSNYRDLCYGLHVIENESTDNYQKNLKSIPDGMEGPNQFGWIVSAWVNPDFRNWDAESMIRFWDNDFTTLKGEITRCLHSLQQVIVDNPNLFPDTKIV